MSIKPAKKSLPLDSVKAQHQAIKKAMRVFFEESGLDPQYVSFKFSDDMPELNGSARGRAALQPKGFMMSASHHTSGDPAKQGAVLDAVEKFTEENPLEGFKTYATYFTCVSAKTWEDVAAGMNEQFERLGSKARVDISPFKAR